MKRLTSIFQGKRRGPKKTPWSFVTSQLFFTSFGSDPTAQAARPRTARRPGRACGAWLSKLKRQVSKPKAISSSMGQASGAILELGQLGRAQSTLISPPVTVRVARSSTILYPASGVQGDRHIYIYILYMYLYIHTFIYVEYLPDHSTVPRAGLVFCCRPSLPGLSSSDLHAMPHSMRFPLCRCVCGSQPSPRPFGGTVLQPSTHFLGIGCGPNLIIVWRRCPRCP